MANELLSVPVAASSIAIAAGALGLICKKAKPILGSDKIALMGIMGAFVFAAQMLQFPLPAMPGTSGHLIGAVLLAIMLGPRAGAIVISSVVIVQCLIFQDGGLLAIGCNVINMGIVPSYLGYFLYRLIAANSTSGLRTYAGVMFGCVIAIEVGAILIPAQAALSGVLLVPFKTFLITMLGVHLLTGFIEGLITVAVLGFIQQVRPDIFGRFLAGKIRLSRRALLVSFAAFAVVAAAGLSLLACGFPDGLQWSYAQRPDQPNFKPMVSNNNLAVAKVDNFQAKFSPLPDYSKRASNLGAAADKEISAAAGWTSLAGVTGAALTMLFVWLTAKLLRKRELVKAC
jgi:cobalt/nickel transport system permease protein